MQTNFEIDDKKMTQLMAFGNFNTKKGATVQTIDKFMRYLALHEPDSSRQKSAW